MAVKSRRPAKSSRSVGKRRRQNKFVTAATWTLVGTAAAGAVAVAFITFPVLFSRVEVAGKPIVRIYDRKDQLACTLSGNEERLPIVLSKVSPWMQKATIAAEDHLFYEHNGVNFSSIARAAIVDVTSGRALEGGSTITQQLAKNLYSKGIRRSIPQKIREAVLAWQLEKDNSKDKILEAYLNEVYFGRGAYGIERAANQYFAKSAQNLTLAESAYLAGIISSPSRLSSPEHYPEARTRQRQVIDSMLACHFINAEQANKAKASALKFQNSAAASSHYLYYVDAVTQILNDKMPELENSKQDIDIFTNLDPSAQRQAELAINKGIIRAPKGVNQGALVSISVKDGAVIALVGGAGDFYKHQWNRAINPHTVGSSFKPFVYLAAILSGTATPHTVLHDEPISIPQDGGPSYSPQDFDHQFLGAMTVREALAKSRNVCAVQLAYETGIDKVIKTANLAGVTTKLNPDLSLALGSCAVSPLDMASAYSTFARGGVEIEPSLIRRVSDHKGKVLYDPSSAPKRVFDRESIAKLVDMMQDVVEYGTGQAARIPGRAIAGKTGTADQAKDLWFIGFTPDTVTATWGGNDQNLPIPGTRATGGTVMAGIWHDYMLSFYKSHSIPPSSFPAPAEPMDHTLSSEGGFIPDAINSVEAAEQKIENKVEQVIDDKPHKKKGFFGLFKKVLSVFD